MAAVLRVKRPLNQDPVEALYLATASKRLKTEVGCDIEEKSCFTFFGTVGREQKCSTDLIERLVSGSKEASIKHSDALKTGRLRKEPPDESSEGCFGRLKRLRRLEECSSMLQVFDLVNEDEWAADSESDGDSQEYVYDVYYNNSVIDESYIDQTLSVEACTLGGASHEPVLEYDTDDSNEENNWRNDYPDDDPDDNWSNEDVDHVVGLLAGVKIDESDLSSESDEGFLYPKVDEDEDRFGKAYADYKRRIAKEMGELSSSSSGADYSENIEEENEDEGN